MNIAFISDGNPNDNRLWSGTIRQMYNVLSEEHNVEYIDVSNRSVCPKIFNKIIAKTIRVFTGKKYNASYSIINAKRESYIVEKKVKKQKYDFVFCPAKSGSIAYSRINVPVVYLTDATFIQMVDYYEHLTNLSGLTMYEGNELERRAIEKSKIVICASDWAKNSVINDYKKCGQDVKILPFGANIEEVTSTKAEHDCINLLFCGVDWKRKGGETAVKTVRELKSRGNNVNLYLVGCNPPESYTESYIKTIGFLNKNNPEEKEKLKKIYEETDFLLLPTVAECAGIVFAEASGNGIPSITYDTGGVGTYVMNGINGYRLPLGSGHEEFADLIEKCIFDNTLSEKLKDGARKYYRETLNWNSWRKEFDKITEGVVIE